MYLNTIRVDPNQEAYIVMSNVTVICIGMYWIVLVCMSTCMLVLDDKLIVNIPAILHLNPLLMQYLLLILQKWVCVWIFSPHCDRMVRGKGHGSFRSQTWPSCHIHPQESTYPSCLACYMEWCQYHQLVSEAGVPRSWTLAQSRQGLGRYNTHQSLLWMTPTQSARR